MTGSGNYQHYQGSTHRHLGLARAAAHIRDPRLVLVARLRPGVFQDKRVLDVGCNNGAVTVQVASLFGAECATGIDVDADLILQAKGHLSFQHSRSKPGTVPSPDTVNYFPISSVLNHGHRPFPSERDAGRRAFPNNVCFECEDWVLAGTSSALQTKYDTILALSVLKWIHLQHLDAGLERFITKCNASLPKGGHLVLEVQPWTSYEKAVHPKKSPHLASNFARLQIRPDDFGVTLKRLGFGEVARSDELPRLICIYEKLSELGTDSA